MPTGRTWCVGICQTEADNPGGQEGSQSTLGRVAWTSRSRLSWASAGRQRGRAAMEARKVFRQEGLSQARGGESYSRNGPRVTDTALCSVPSQALGDQDERECAGSLFPSLGGKASVLEHPGGKGIACWFLLGSDRLLHCGKWHRPLHGISVPRPSQQAPFPTNFLPSPA